jgi:Mg2+ and Co2+ transporter CorA
MMDAKTVSTLFGPLDRKFCDWFFYLTVVAFVFMVLTLVSGLYVFVEKKFDLAILFPVVWSVLMYELSL